jgi:hypothetical protein
MGEWQGERTEVLTQIALIRQALEALTEDIHTLSVTVKERVDAQAREIEVLRTRDAAQQVKCVEQCAIVANNARDLTALGRRLEMLEKLAPVMKAVVWIAGLLGAAVMALIWSLITGQASLILP